MRYLTWLCVLLVLASMVMRFAGATFAYTVPALMYLITELNGRPRQRFRWARGTLIILISLSAAAANLSPTGWQKPHVVLLVLMSACIAVLFVVDMIVRYTNKQPAGSAR